MFTGINDPSRWVLPAVLDEMAEVRGNEVWITTTDGDSVTFAQMAKEARKVAGYFASQGVKPGDYVVVWMRSSIDLVRAWFGLGYLGAVSVLLNTELHGAFLKHQLNDSGAALAVVDADLLLGLDGIAAELSELRTLMVVRETAAPELPFARLPWEGWRQVAPWRGELPKASDIACIMYTSGTSGPAKGVLMPHAHCALYGVGTIHGMQLMPTDKYYICLPLFHANGLLIQLGATLLAGIPAVLSRRFSASSWLPDIRRSGATVTNLLGATAAFVVAQPPSPQDKDHCLRAVKAAPNLAAHENAFHERFGIRDVVSGFGMTEANSLIWGRLGVSTPDTVGWVHEQHFEVIIADPETDTPMPPNEVGEILVRPKVPFGFMAGYHNLPGKTVEAWRNLWFHTGDAGTMSEEGLVTFVDRIKDCIRRRGENISATEIETLVGGLPGIQEVAAYAVPSDLPGGEDEVMLALVARPGHELRLEEVAHQADELLPRFARPRFLRVLDELPKTATGKVQRAVLRKEGIEGALDRDSPGVRNAS